MQWTDVIQNVLVPIGAFLGGGWILNFYNAKPKKNSIEIENMKVAMGELQKVINQLMETNEARSKDSEAYRKETSQTIKELKDEVSEMKIKLDIKHEAIYASERCDKIEDTNECIVMKTFKERCQECLKNN